MSRQEREDAWTWLPESLGVNTVRSGYREVSPSSGVSCLHEENLLRANIWNMKIPPKVIVLIWLACRDLLPTALALAGKRVLDNKLCLCCGAEVEDTIHALVLRGSRREAWK